MHDFDKKISSYSDDLKVQELANKLIKQKSAKLPTDDSELKKELEAIKHT